MMTTRDRILSYLTDHPRATFTDILETTGADAETLERNLRYLQRADAVTRHPPTAHDVRRWSITTHDTNPGTNATTPRPRHSSRTSSTATSYGPSSSRRTRTRRGHWSTSRSNRSPSRGG